MAQRRGRSWVCPAWGPLAAAGTWVWGQVEDLVKQLGPPGNESQRAHTGYPLHPAFLLLSPRGHRQHRADAGSQNLPRPPGASLQLPAGVSLAPSPGNMIQATPSAPVMTLTALRPPCTWEPRKCPSTGSAQVPVCPPSGRSTSMYTVGSSTRNRAHCSPPLVEDLRVHKPGSQCGGQVQAQSQEPAWAGTASGCPSTSHSPESEEPRVATPGSSIVRGCTYKPIKARPHTKMELGGSSANQPVQPQCLQQ